RLRPSSAGERPLAGEPSRAPDAHWRVSRRGHPTLVQRGVSFSRLSRRENLMGRCTTGSPDANAQVAPSALLRRRSRARSDIDPPSNRNLSSALNDGLNSFESRRDALNDGLRGDLTAPPR